MKKRLRKKKHLGEFKELGFEVRGDLRPGLAGDDINENGPGGRSPRPVFTSGSPACARGDLWAPRAGLEPATIRLTVAGHRESSQEVAPLWGNRGATQIAQRVIAAVSSGAVEPELLAQLADAVLDVDAVRLALEVRAGGVHAVRRAIELAAIVLAASANSGAEAANKE